MGWVENRRPGNDGAVGNTLEDLLGIQENNLPLANAGEWEIKSKRATTSSLLTIGHLDPSPNALSLVTRSLLPKYGWLHKEAGKKYSVSELSFRQTIRSTCRTDRGFGLVVDRVNSKVEISFDYRAVSGRHHDWLNSVDSRVGLGELNPQPYWGFYDLLHHIGTKVHNTFFAIAENKKISGVEYFRYSRLLMLMNLNVDRLIDAIERGDIRVDFDARTHHNHGTKFRLPSSVFPSLFETTIELTDEVILSMGIDTAPIEIATGGQLELDL